VDDTKTPPDKRVVASPYRIAELDALRGFALFGILITNVVVVSALFTAAAGKGGVPLFQSTTDKAVLTMVDILFLGKFFLLFSFLFGYSFTLQLAAAARAGVSAVARLSRRCGVLFLIGLAHVLFLWVGDILTLYAALCLILLALRGIRPLVAALLGGGLLLASAALALSPDEDDSADLGSLDFVWMHEAFTGGPQDTLTGQLTVAPEFMSAIWWGQGPPALGMFLLGLAAGKARLLDGGRPLPAWLVRLQWIGLASGAAMAVWLVVRMDESALPGHGDAVQLLTNPLVTGAYMVTVVRIARRDDRVARVLAPAGRMAATNYIAQSLVFALLYTGYGLALVDQVPPLGVVSLAVVTFVLQLTASAWWLRRHPYGPVEWLMRAATNAQFPRWRSVAR
jgi:uncharacterized protein